MNLDETQKERVARWLDEGLKLSEIQTRLASDFGVKLTYMEVRFLVDDLNLTPKEPEKVEDTSSAEAGSKGPETDSAAGPEKEVTPPSGVSVTVDTITKPGMLASGKVTFSDGAKADWYLDQMGRLGLSPETQGYRPSAADVQEFQVALEREVSRAGL